MEGEEIILCAGGLKSPHLLMLSGIGPEDQLNALNIPVVHSLAGVGQNLRNHPSASVGLLAREDVELPVDTFHPRTALRYTSSGSEHRNDIMVMTSSRFVTLSGEALPDRAIRISCALELPAGFGELRIVSADPTQQPEFHYHYLEDPWDRERMREAVRLCARFAESEEYRGIVSERTAPTDEELASDDLLDEYLFRTQGTSRHVSGTCKMGPTTDDMAVVDQYGSVYGGGRSPGCRRRNHPLPDSCQYQCHSPDDRRTYRRFHQGGKIAAFRCGPGSGATESLVVPDCLNFPRFQELSDRVHHGRSVIGGIHYLGIPHQVSPQRTARSGGCGRQRRCRKCPRPGGTA